MINNKGFAVSTVLYTLLIAFLMFLGVALAQFETSSGIIGKANDDLVNGTKFEVSQIKTSNECNDGIWYNNSNTLVRIKSKYGTMYWPKDFYDYDTTSGMLGEATNLVSKDGYTYSVNKNIGILCSYDGFKWGSCVGYDISKYNTPSTVCDTTIQGICFSKDELNSIKQNIDFVYNNLNPNNIDDTSNPFLYRTTELNEIRQNFQIGNPNVNLMMVNYYSLPIENLISSNIKFYGNNDYLSMCLGNSNNIYIDIQRLINYNLSVYYAEITCNNSGSSFSEYISNYKVSNNLLINQFNTEKYENIYPILYSDDSTFGYVPSLKKVYLLKNEKIISLSIDEFNSYIEKLNNSNSKQETHFYIKVFDNILSDVNSNESNNIIVKGLYNICE